ncbi:MAG: hypothetical protein ACRBF0_13130 [Calditrichia bacterium]
MELRNQLTEYFFSQGLGAFSEELTFIVVDRLLRFELPYIRDAIESDVILALSFGNRTDADGNTYAGPINEQIAALASRYYKERPRKVYAQWEVADGLRNDIPEEHLIRLEPFIDTKSGDEQYLSTQAIVNQMSINHKHGTSVFVVGHRDQLVRATWIAENGGFLAYSDSAMMTGEYDSESSQLWTRTRMSYLKHDFLSRLRLI